MVKWIGKLSLLLKRFQDVLMDILSMSILSEEQRTNHYLIAVTQENTERLARGEKVLDPNTS